MTVIKPGDLVALRSGGPTMTVDTVNTDIFDDNKITGVLCAWFVGEKLQRVRFDHRAIEPVLAQEAWSEEKVARLEEATGEYKTVLDETAIAMNIPADAERDVSKAVDKQPKPASSPRRKAAALPVANGVGAIP